MGDTFNVVASYNQASYTAGQIIKITISGNAIQTIVSQSQIGPLVIPIIAADGVTSTISMPSEQASITTTIPQAVVIDTALPIVDTSSTPRVWAVSTDKLSITAIA